MTRYRLLVEYDGRGLVGWQRQDNGDSVQGFLEQALTRFLPAGSYSGVTGSGRTDAGVHALGQVAHVDVADEAALPAERMMGALNYHLKPAAIAVRDVQIAEVDFHARFQARQRHYIYRIINRRAPLTFERGLAWHVAQPLDAEAMHDAAQVFVGEHDFTTFRHVQCQAKSPIKTLDYIRVTRTSELISVDVGARSFLHHQVRSMVGCLKMVGDGKWTAADLKAALKARDRQRLGLNAPPDGLYFARIDF